MDGHQVKSRRQTARSALLIATACVAAVSLAACGTTKPANHASSSAKSSVPPSAPSSAPSSAPAAAPPPVKVQGKVDSVTGTTVSLTAKAGPTKVIVAASTRVAEISPAQLLDVTNGSCVDVNRPAAAPGKPALPARSIVISAPPASGNCPQSAGTPLRGTVASVNGQTVSVTTATGTPPTAIAVDPKTQYLKRTATSALVITQGVCMTASGAVDPSGALQATSVSVGPPPKKDCPGT
jgi:hypothetical protein